jgi:undecaprenyl-diphosphatase
MRLVSSTLSWLEAGVVGAFQGVAELFPISSLGHSVLIPALIGGSWSKDLNVSAPESPYLAFIVALHVATALALVTFFWRDWVRIMRGLGTSIWRREVRDADQRLAWLLILATIPVGLTGLLLEHTFRTTLGKPVPAAIFLTINGLILLGAERLRRNAPDGGASLQTTYVDERITGPQSDAHLAKQSVWQAVGIGSTQILALCPGISRSGIAMVGGLARGMTREDAARFSYLLATPVILAAGALKIGDLTGPLGADIRPQALFGAVLSFIGAYLSVRYLTRYFANRSLRPFGFYCLLVGIGSLIVFAVRG